MKTIIAQQKEVEKELMEYLVKTTPFPDVCARYDFTNYSDRISAMAKKFKIDEWGCQRLISAYEELLKQDRAAAATYGSYINNTSGSIDYESGITSANKLAADARYVFDYTFPEIVSDILMSRYYDLLNGLKVDEITLERLQEMFKHKVDITKLNNKPLIWMYNSYIKTTKKRVVIKDIKQKIELSKTEIKDLESQCKQTIEAMEYELKRLDKSYREMLERVDYYICEFGFKKVLTKFEYVSKNEGRLKKALNKIIDFLKPKSNLIKLKTLPKNSLEIQPWQDATIEDFSIEKLSEESLVIDEQSKKALLLELGLTDVEEIPQNIYELIKDERQADNEMEQIDSYLDILKQMIEGIYKKYCNCRYSYEFQYDYTMPKYFDRAVQQLAKVFGNVRMFKRGKYRKTKTIILNSVNSSREVWLESYKLSKKSVSDSSTKYQRKKDDCIKALSEIKKKLVTARGGQSHTYNQISLEKSDKVL